MLLLALLVVCVVLVVFDLVAWRWGFDSRLTRDSRAVPDWKWPEASEDTGTPHYD